MLAAISRECRGLSENFAIHCFLRHNIKHTWQYFSALKIPRTSPDNSYNHHTMSPLLPSYLWSRQFPCFTLVRQYYLQKRHSQNPSLSPFLMHLPRGLVTENGGSVTENVTHFEIFILLVSVDPLCNRCVPSQVFSSTDWQNVLQNATSLKKCLKQRPLRVKGHTYIWPFSYKKGHTGKRPYMAIYW